MSIRRSRAVVNSHALHYAAHAMQSPTLATGRVLLQSAVFMLMLGMAGLHTPARAANQATPSTSIMPLDQVRVGMKGYGLTVFHGTKIEPFAVEVLSVMRDFGPKRGVVWVRCPEQRMRDLGPVQGMSGSPVYLWSDDEPHELGQGGRLIGAYAFGFGASKDCLVGVQPIELMIDAADRVNVDPPGNTTTQPSPDPSVDKSIPFTNHTWRNTPPPNVRGMMGLLQSLEASEPSAWRARSLMRLHPDLTSEWASSSAGSHRQIQPLGPTGVDGEIQPMMLPMVVGSAQTANAVAGALEPLGIVPVPVLASAVGLAGPRRLTAGKPPPGIDPQQIKFAPGSALSIPLAFGDLDMSALGTVTDVLPDGRVLGFGHAMFGLGPAALPMATGYVHVIMPSLLSSFKLGGSGAIHGAIVRDENSAVIGTATGQYTTATVDVSVAMPDQDEKRYHYNAVHHRQLTPIIASILVLESMTATSSMPDESTLHLQGQLQFTGGRSLNLNSMISGASDYSALVEILPVMTMIMGNPHEATMLESMQISARVEPALRLGSMVNAQLDHDEYDPGDTLGISVQVQPYGKPVTKHRMELVLPQSLAPGDYELFLCDAKSYVDLLFETHPHLLTTANVDDLYTIIRRLLKVRNDAVYVILQLPDTALAVGRQEMPRLPSSRRSLMESSVSTLAVPYREWVEEVVEMDMVIHGVQQFTVRIR